MSKKISAYIWILISKGKRERVLKKMAVDDGCLISVEMGDASMYHGKV